MHTVELYFGDMGGASYSYETKEEAMRKINSLAVEVDVKGTFPTEDGFIVFNCKNLTGITYSLDNSKEEQEKLLKEEGFI